MTKKNLKVLLFNGSPNKEGCTYTALSEIAKTLKEEGKKAGISKFVLLPVALKPEFK